jgi:hypothetical protein
LEAQAFTSSYVRLNVFVLCTGRCGSTTFAKACRHIKNFSAAHESRSGFIGAERFNFPPNHIEVDNRLAWFLGRLDRAYGNDAVYVHLKRNTTDTAQSFFQRYNNGIIDAYRSRILMGNPPETSPISVCLDYCDTVNSNIEAFLKDKTRTLTVALETVRTDFTKFWDLIGAEGNREKALAVWDRVYNASMPDQNSAPGSAIERSALGWLADRLNRHLRKLGFRRSHRLKSNPTESKAETT